jgi:hypothetical protein
VVVDYLLLLQSVIILSIIFVSSQEKKVELFGLIMDIDYGWLPVTVPALS